MGPVVVEAPLEGAAVTAGILLGDPPLTKASSASERAGMGSRQ